MAAGGAIRRRSIGTLAQRAQARYRTGAQKSHNESMIPKSGYRFSEKIMLQQWRRRA
jgi:hypothetical protein